MIRPLHRAIARGLVVGALTLGAAGVAGVPEARATAAGAAPTGAPDGTGEASASAEAAPPPTLLPAGLETPWQAIGGDPVGEAIRTAWQRPASTLDARVERTLQAGLGMGFRDLEAPARALLFASREGSELARAEAAARLAPELPATRAALAQALLVEARDPLAATGELLRAFQVLPHHLEGWLWTRAVALELAAPAAVAGGLLFLLVAGGALVPTFGRQLLGRLRVLPPASRFAFVGALLLAPAALGEGLLGLALALTALGFAYGSFPRRLCVGAAAALVVAGLHPLAEAAGRAEVAIFADPVVLAASNAERGLPSADELARVARHAEADPLAARASALRARREGRLGEADAAYAQLLAAGSAGPRLLNNAANVALALDHQDRAIALYEEAAALEPGPAILFNLSQAYGRAVRLDDQDAALSEAQALDADAVAELADLFSAYSSSAVVDLPLDVATALPRLQAPEAAAARAEAFRRRIAPSGAAHTLEATATLFGVAAALGLVLGFAVRRLAGEAADDDLYADIARLLQRKGTDPGERKRRLDALRARQARLQRLQGVLGALLPGAAGLLARQPVLALLGCVAFAGAATLALLRDRLVTDPLAVGALAPILGGGLFGLLVLVYLAQLVASLSMREKA